MKEYKIIKAEKLYVIVDSKGSIKTPGGSEFASSDQRLIQLVYDDMNRYGPNPTKSSSFISLHASYLDFGCQVPQQELRRNILGGYSHDWDVILQTYKEFDIQYKTASFTTSSEESGVVLDPIVYFGPAPEREEIITWLNSLSRRALASMQVCGGTFHSILLGYRLLNPSYPIPIKNIVKAFVLFDYRLPDSFGEDKRKKIHRVISFLDKIRIYSSFPD